MSIKQISAFVENKPGQLAKFTDVLTQHGIDMRALSLAETEDFGIVRVITDDSYKTACVLKEAGYIFSITPVIAVEIPDIPGGLNKVLHLLNDKGVNIEYTYAFTARKQDTAYMIFRVTDNEAAAEILKDNGICMFDLEDID
ncbi:MAG: ACT domain-containing protein [Clostridia bacterium]|nr:ACT domain-containing protein [Clostridia bacterium]